MPIVFNQTLTPAAQLALWRIEESVAALEALCTPEEVAHAMGFSSESRRREWLAWRALLHRMLPGARPSYDNLGGPILTQGRYLGVSHTSRTHHPVNEREQLDDAHNKEGYAAVIVAQHPCGVDIEYVHRDFSRVARRFISPKEGQLASCFEANGALGMIDRQRFWPTKSFGEALPLRSEDLFLAVACCAKEALYKWGRVEGASLVGDLEIESIDPQKQILSARFYDQPVTLHFLLFEHLCCVWVVKRDRTFTPTPRIFE